VLDQKNAVEVIELVLEQAGFQLVGFDADLVPVKIAANDVNLLRAHDVPRQARNRQASFVEFPLAIRFDDLRVDQRMGFLTHLEVVDKEALSDANLRRRQTEAGFGIHGFQHVFRQLHERAVDIGDLLGDLFQHRVAVRTDAIGGAHGIQGYRWLVISESEGASHYFDDTPQTASKRRSIELVLPDTFLPLETDAGVFSGTKVDAGTKYLLLDMPEIPPNTGAILDLGCGYGPIALTAARRCPTADVWAVDINTRARELASDNASANGLTNVTVAGPEDVPSDLRFDLILSNPPIRIGKAALHALLETWLPTLADTGRAWMVVQKHLGSDSLATWLTEQGWPTTRLGSRKGYRLLETTR